MPWKVYPDLNVYMQVSFDDKCIDIFFYLTVTWISLDFTTCNMGLQGQGDLLLFEELLTLGQTQFPRLWHPKVLCGRIGKLRVFLPQGTLGLSALGPVRKLLLYMAQPGHQTQPLPGQFYKKSPTDNISWFSVAFTDDLWSTERGHSARDLPLVSPWLYLTLLISSSHSHLLEQQIPPLTPH